MSDVNPETVPPAPADTERDDDQWYLNDEREFLLRSLQDADREHEAGDLSDADHEVLMVRDRARLAEVEGELAERHPEALLSPITDVAPLQKVGRSEWRRIGIVASCFFIVAGVLILVDHARHPRLPGQASSGSITVTKAQLIEQQLEQALTLNNQSKDVAALKLYDEVLSEDPTNPQALADAGWLQWNSGFAANDRAIMLAGRSEVAQAVQVAPSFYQAHLFLGLILANQDDNASGAVTQFNLFLADDPPTASIAQVAPLLSGVYAKAGDPVPAALKGTTSSPSPSSTTTPTSTP